MSTVLVTGASGFIGSFLVEEGLRRGHTIYAGMRDGSSRKYLQDPQTHFVTLDLSSSASLEIQLKHLADEGVKFDYIIHCAGVTKVRKKDEFTRVNVDCTRNLIEALRDTGLVPQKFLYLSSLAAFGPGDPDTGRPVMLSDMPKPIEAYGKSKLKAEQYIRTACDFPWIIFRPTGVYGPRETDYFVFFQTINRGLEPYIGFQPQILTFIYVRDLARLIFDAIFSSQVYKSYFVTDGREYNSRTFAAITRRHLGKKTIAFTLPACLVRVIAIGMESLYSLWGAIPTLNTDKYRVMSSTNWRCDIAPLQQDFGFAAEYDLDRGVKEALEWYKHEGWL